jgi:L-rhamnose-H+ transport protein
VATGMGFGICAVLLGGTLQASVFFPMKFTERWHWENIWACFSTVAYLLSPWVLACLLVTHFPQLLWDISPRTLITTLLFGVGMGCGALMMGLAYSYVGMAIVFAIVLGISSSIGTLVPLIVLAPEQLFRRQGLSTMAGVFIALVGTAVVGWAGWERDARKTRYGAAILTAEKGSTRKLWIGLGLSIASGLLSSCANLGFAFGGQISERAHALGAGPTGAASALWSVILLPVFLFNFGYSLYLLRKNRSAHLFRLPGTIHYWGLGIAMGLGWMAGMTSYGAGALSLGRLGTSIGWILFSSCMIIVANVLGAFTGEWKGAPTKARAIMAAGIAILTVAIAVVGTA